MKNTARSLVALFVLLGLPQLASAQTTAAGSSFKPSFGVAVKAGTLGVGIDAAVSVHRKVNLRGTFNFLSISHDFVSSEQNTTYTGDLSFKSLVASLDYFPFGGGFHISPIFMLTNKNTVSLSTSVAAGKTIDIDNVSYQSSASNPIKGGGDVTFKGGRPGVVLGFGNIAGGHRVTVPFELGVIFSDAPIAHLSFTGTACQTNGSNCKDVATDATIQSHVKAQEADLNNTVKPFRFYPMLSLGLSFRF